MIRKGFTSELKDADREDLTIVAHISTMDLDRDGEVVLPDGARLEEYRKNPVVLWHHDYGPDSLPIGKNLWIKTDKRGLLAKTQFNPKDDFARDVFGLYADGYMAGWSIGADAVERRDATEDEIKKHPEWARAKAIWAAWTLLEYSAVKVPANPNALTLESLGSRALAPITLKYLGLETPKQEEAMAAGEPVLLPFNPLKPYPNEHAARLQPPDKYDEFRRQNDKFGDGIHAIWGIIVGPPRKSELQAIRFDAKKFTVAEAKAWLKEHDYKPIAFEPAAGEGRSIHIVVPAPPRIQRMPRIEVQQPDIRALIRREIRRALGFVSE